MLLKDEAAAKQILPWLVAFKELLFSSLCDSPPWELLACCRTGHNLI